MSEKQMTKEEESMHRQEAVDRFERLTKYINSLFDRMDAERKRFHHTGFVMLAALATQMLVFHFAPYNFFLFTIADMLFYVMFIYFMLGRLFILGRLTAELEGCIKTIEILGIFPDRAGNARKRFKLENPFQGLSKLWDRLKVKQQKEVYGYA